MSDYRLFYLNEQGRIYLGVEIVAEDDRAAQALAADHRTHSGLELWSGARLVAKIPADGPVFSRAERGLGA